ncbi:M48 family metallopeptidase [Mesorhizobium sp. B3-1-7]|uniref:M48 family metallopeptidase n=1 Tax=Mesorhizobium sp. B3-1-7 TaxID=2589894 RepID=UPI001128A501|nr:SprT family zinc-dependent metalloprotease [Mesorhizobium sp. B3-1-7]TPI58655.1 M48 family metallopeptidase [Mesorhizobium sp. B3-1-7]
MNTEVLEIAGLEVELVRKPIKNLHLGVYPPEGRVRVAAPPTVSDEAVRVAVVSRMGWINRQRNKFKAQARQSQREYVSGETYFHLGQRYRLRVIEQRKASGVRISGDQRLEVAIPPGNDVAFREKVFQRWQRALLRERALVLIDEWSARLGVAPPTLGIKRMKTKWGTCNHAARRIWLNLELIKKPPVCISYIVLHEIAHLLEANHGEAFVAILDLHMPNWRTHKDQLNAEPLAHEEWVG